ncbi:hypothetical protein [Anaeroarcus burkinensis]|uniref:hypothetical protein n=1 Tax=Anaeroarcus burkinensis TaxID=82376 RepID=UPI0003FC764D|nr:hypothetical protein [Anaeroarcus burkinensis]
MKASLEKEITELLAQYNITGEVAQEVLRSAEKAANDLAVSSGKSAESAMETVLEATKFQLEFLAEHPEAQAVIVGDDGLIKEIHEVHHVGRNICEVVKTFTPNEEKQVKALRVAMKAEARIEVEEAMAAETAEKTAKGA